MTFLEKKSERKKISILSLVNKGEYSAGYALMLIEQLSDEGKLTDSDYEELAEYIEKLIYEETVEEENETEEIEETVENITEESEE